MAELTGATLLDHGSGTRAACGCPEVPPHRDLCAAAGSQPKSVFQLVGGGQVGRGSLYGMQALHRLAAAGFRIWPFDEGGLPLVVEVFPRLLTGLVIKSRQSERERYLSTLGIPNEFSAAQRRAMMHPTRLCRPWSCPGRLASCLPYRTSPTTNRGADLAAAALTRLAKTAS